VNVTEDPWLSIISISRHNSEYLERMNQLLPQLSKDLPPVNKDDLFDIASQDDFCSFVVRDHHYPDKGYFLGTATIFFRRLWSGWVGEIHDVIVDEAFRRHGFGRLLTNHLFGVAGWKAHKLGQPIKLTLTSRPERAAANAMYLQHGFKLAAECVKLPDGSYDPEGTNLYRKTIFPSK